jgi:hypothetical protein
MKGGKRCKAHEKTGILNYYYWLSVPVPTYVLPVRYRYPVYRNKITPENGKTCRMLTNGEKKVIVFQKNEKSKHPKHLILKKST